MLCRYKIKFFLILILAVVAPLALAEDQTTSISARQEQIKKLEQEIKTYRQKLDTTRKEANSLSKEIKQIDLTSQKLGTEINITQQKIGSANQNIQILQKDIRTKEQKMNDDKSVLAKALRQVNGLDRVSLPEILLASAQASAAWSEIDRLISFNEKIDAHYWSLQDIKTQLEHAKTSKEREKSLLADAKQNLADQKVVVEQTKQKKSEILTVTKSKEANYQKLLADRLEKKRQVEAEIASIEAAMKADIKPGSLPKSGTTALGWPVTPVRITQYFGNTTFASQHAAVYNGQGHNGVDLDLETGDPVKAAADGRVVGAGDTDKTCPSASFGKWVLIEHNNGLSSLYAHLSLIKVGEGQAVSAGQTIGLGGNTGYSTGSHLHFSVYASAGVKVSSMKSKVAGCGTYILPIASHNSYLNPLSYLPK